ncbi:MIF4G domain protein [Reticulomyxa filosa]|uniref:MIF4G domain protein n=1 Tax=Reticulomyxa filosa TaxID=46433 RepID=X6NZ24_RETFI|nr:MIF4G domain protein [Reticulomyxa filosa]|eukprot:ETO30527.1 MIF4G domain protein [Reticulomyxa filosa]
MDHLMPFMEKDFPIEIFYEFNIFLKINIMQFLGFNKDVENKSRSKTRTTLAVNARKISRLEKRSRHLAVWRERWCLLSEPSKFYTYKSNDFSQKPTEVIDLSNFYVQPDTLLANHFRLFRKHKLKRDADESKDDNTEEMMKNDPRHFHFRGDLKDVLEWIAIIRELESVQFCAVAPYINCALNARVKRAHISNDDSNDESGAEHENENENDNENDNDNNNDNDNDENENGKEEKSNDDRNNNQNLRASDAIKTRETVHSTTDGAISSSAVDNVL